MSTHACDTVKYASLMTKGSRGGWHCGTELNTQIPPGMITAPDVIHSSV